MGLSQVLPGVPAEKKNETGRNDKHDVHHGAAAKRYSDDNINQGKRSHYSGSGH